MEPSAKSLSVTVAGTAVLVVVGSALWFGVGFRSSPMAPPLPEVSASIDRADSMTVHVTGAVNRPGVVSLAAEARIVDAIVAAGGARPDAALDAVDLARTVNDGMTVLIPTIGDHPRLGTSPRRFDLNTADAAAFEDLPGIGPVLARRIVDFREEHGPFNTLEDLLAVPGIGEAKLMDIRSIVEQP